MEFNSFNRTLHVPISRVRREDNTETLEKYIAFPFPNSSRGPQSLRSCSTATALGHSTLFKGSLLKAKNARYGTILYIKL